MHINLFALRTAFDLMISEVESAHGPFIELEQSLYWDIPHNYLYAVNPVLSLIEAGQLPFLVLASLEDDICRLAGIAAGNQDVLQDDLVWVAGILRYIGELPLAGTRNAKRRPEEASELAPRQTSRHTLFEAGRRLGAAEARRAALLEMAELVSPSDVPRLQKLQHSDELTHEVKSILMNAQKVDP